MFTTQKNNLNTKNNVQNSQNWTLLTGGLIYFIVTKILWRYFWHVQVWESAPWVCIAIRLLQAIKNARLRGSIDFNGAVLTAKCLFLKMQVSAEASVSVCQRIKLAERKSVKWIFFCLAVCCLYLCLAKGAPLTDFCRILSHEVSSTLLSGGDARSCSCSRSCLTPLLIKSAGCTACSRGWL